MTLYASRVCCVFADVRMVQVLTLVQDGGPSNWPMPAVWCVRVRVRVISLCAH
jgi:hypothetical protein